MTETLQDRLRQVADDSSDHPPTFWLYFEAADRIDELEQAAKARADSDAEELAELKAERKAPALRSTGTIITVGEIHVCENYEADPAERLLTMVSGLLIKADDEALRAIARFLY